jgi:hypothetical protein
MTIPATPDPNNLTQPSGQPPPVHPPHPEPGQQRPVVIQNTADDATMRGIQATLADMGNKLAGLPEAIANGVREVTGLTAPPPPPAGQTPPAGQSTSATPPPAGQTAPPAGEQTPPEGKKTSGFHRFWFGDKR